MASNKKEKIATIVVNWNGEADSLACIDALNKQTLDHTIIAVDNGSVDGFTARVAESYQEVILLKNKKNLGFSGGVNTGIRYALENGFNYIALINNDAQPEPNWLNNLMVILLSKPRVGIVTGKIIKMDGSIDTTGDFYTSWGIPFPRGRNAKDVNLYNNEEYIFSACGGASAYRTSMLEEIGLFDEDYFAYYEDIDLGFRAQLAGWKVYYTPNAVVRHKVGGTSGKINGFTLSQKIKNYPFLFWKNVPIGLVPLILPRFIVAYIATIYAGFTKGSIKLTTKSLFLSVVLLPKKLLQRYLIQKKRKVSTAYIKSMLVAGLPPELPKNAKLIKIRSFARMIKFWR
jgi:GT2 family glycosyltransferase